MSRQRRASAASRALPLAFVLILVPGFALGYLGFRALAERETSLRTNYTATTVLARDRLAAELTRLESQLPNAAARLPASLDDHAAVRFWLETAAADNPWLAEPFLLRVEGGIITRDLRAGWSPEITDPGEMPPTLAPVLRQAEAAEFVQGNLEDALQKYRRALAAAALLPARGLVVTRAGRTLFKLRRFDEAIAQYQTVLALPPEAVDPNGLPFASSPSRSSRTRSRRSAVSMKGRAFSISCCSTSSITRGISSVDTATISAARWHRRGNPTRRSQLEHAP